MVDEEFHSLHPDCLGLRMSYEDLSAIHSAMQEIQRPLDFRLILFALKQNGFITEFDYNTVLTKMKSCRSKGWQKALLCINEAAQLITFNDLVFIFHAIGYGDVARILCQARFGGSKYVHVNKTSCTAVMHTNYYRLKTTIGNSSFHVNKYVDLENLTTNFINQLNGCLTPGRRQYIYDNLTVLVCLRVHQYNDMSDRDAILQQMFTVGNDHPSLDLTCAKVVYLVSKCYICRKLNKIEEAKHFLTSAKQLCLNIDNSLLKAVVFHAEHALYRKLYGLTQNEENLNQSIVACDRGIASVAYEPKCIRQHWIRDFQLFKAMVLLCIGQEYKIEKSVVPTEENRESAKGILDLLKKDFHEWDDRRETMYRVCMTRLHEDTNLKLALCNIDLAIEHSQKGNYSKAEEEYLADYRNQLEEKSSDVETIYKRVSDTSTTEQSSILNKDDP